MKIVIETHERHTEEIDDLTTYLLENKWDYQVNNSTEALPLEMQEQTNECDHHYINGVCTKCNWLQI